MTLRHFALLSSIVISVWLSVMGCCDPSAIRVRVRNLNNECTLDVDWEGPTAPGVYVSQPGIDVPRVAGGADFDGVVFWGLDTTTFPDMIAGPVAYMEPQPRSTDTNLARYKSPDYPTPLDNIANPTDAYVEELRTLQEDMNMEVLAAGRAPLQTWTLDNLAPGQAVPIDITVVTIPGTISMTLANGAADGPLTCPEVPGDEIVYGTLPRHFGAPDQAQ